MELINTTKWQKTKSCLKKNKIKKNEVVFTYANSVHSENEKYSIQTPNKISISEYT